MIRSLFLAPLALAAFTSTALAHFRLETPPARFAQDTQGNPQKGGPCGGDGIAKPDVTSLTPGQDLIIKVNVTTPHEGYFRVALAKEPLPAAPT